MLSVTSFATLYFRHSVDPEKKNALFLKYFISPLIDWDIFS